MTNGLKRKTKVILSLLLMLLLLTSMTACSQKADDKYQDSYTPTPEFWEVFDSNGITDDLRALDDGAIAYAPYGLVYPSSSESEQRYDFFSVDFYTDSQPDYTYWALADWYMDCSEYMRREGYTKNDTIGAYGGFQDVGEYNTKIMSIWETYFYKSDGTKYTLVPECIYPEEGSTYFDGEGYGTNLVAPFEWKPETWYRYVLRSWNTADTTYVGTWAEDLSTGEVTLLAVFDTFLPESCITGLPWQFLEDYSEETRDEYRQMKLKNYCLRKVDTGEWVFPGEAVFEIWTSLEQDKRGTYRFSTDGDSLLVETCGLGEYVCEGMSDEETDYNVEIRPAENAPDVDRYPIPEL